MLIYNSLTRKREEFVPNVAGKVSMYTCGPTVYHYAHIGNLRSYIMEDVALGMRCSDFCGILDVEVTAWALSGDNKTRNEFGGNIVNRAARLIQLAKSK